MLLLVKKLFGAFFIKLEKRMTLGKYLENVRLNKNMSKRQFAILIGVSNQYIGNIEKDISVPGLIPIIRYINAGADFNIIKKLVKIK